MNDARERPNRWPWPPIVYVIAIAAALAVGQVVAWPVPAVFRPLGMIVLVLGLIVDGWAIVTLTRRDTTFLPHRGSDALVTDGPYRFSRNPIYLANTVALVGLGIALGTMWLVLAALIAAMVVDRIAIRREEAHLAARFPEAWGRYARSVRRWF